MTVHGLHFDTNVFSCAAREPDTMLALRRVSEETRHHGLRVAYSPIVAIELLSGAAPGDEVSVTQTRRRLQEIVETCGDDVLPAPTEVLRALAKGRCSPRALGSRLVAAQDQAMAAGDLGLLRRVARSAAAGKKLMRDDFEYRVKLMQNGLREHGTKQERLEFLASRAWANNYYIMALGQANATGYEMAASREHGMAAIDAHFTAFCELGRRAIQSGEFNPKNTRHDCEDIQLLLYAAMGLALVTKERRVLSLVRGSTQRDMVWHFDEALDRVGALA